MQSSKSMLSNRWRDFNIIAKMSIQSSININIQFTIYKKTTLMPLLLMESDGVTNSSQKLLHVARPICIFFAKLLQLLLQTRSLATHAFTLWLATALLIQSPAWSLRMASIDVQTQGWACPTRFRYMLFQDSQTLFVREDPERDASWTFHVTGGNVGAKRRCLIVNPLPVGWLRAGRKPPFTYVVSK